MRGTRGLVVVVVLGLLLVPGMGGSGRVLAQGGVGATGTGQPAAGAWQPPDQALVSRARRILDRVPLVDGHNDLPWQYRERVKNQLSKIDLSRDTSGLQPGPG
ncbi:MAG: dipeptidase, partial [Acidobacteriota bacterium]|nr:dipeptidase [Acidobacteriota bacterium]